MGETVKGKAAIQQTCDEIKKRIVMHDLKPGERITELDLCKSLGVGRSTVRNALISLSQVGLVELIPNVGARVTVFSRDQVISLMSAKNDIESLALERTFDYYFDVDFKVLRELVNRQQEGIEKKDILYYLQAIEEFHNYIVDKLGNIYMSKMFHILSSDYTIYQLLYDDFYDITFDEFASNRCHPQIIQAIESHDLSLAQDALNEITRVVVSRFDHSHRLPGQLYSNTTLFG